MNEWTFVEHFVQIPFFFFWSETQKKKTLAVLFLLIEYLPSVALTDVLPVGWEAVALVRRLWECVAFCWSLNWRGAGRRLLLLAQSETILFTIYQTFLWLEKEMMNVGNKLKWLLISAFYNLISTAFLKKCTVLLDSNLLPLGQERFYFFICIKKKKKKSTWWARMNAPTAMYMLTTLAVSL